MRLEYESAQNLTRQIRDIIRQHVPDERFRIFFFGSRVTGSGNDRSDIDVGIEGPGPVPFESLAAIEDELEELPTLYKIELVDFARVSSKFRDVANEREYIIV